MHIYYLNIVTNWLKTQTRSKNIDSKLRNFPNIFKTETLLKLTDSKLYTFETY